jgi:hypothetical protein
LAKYVSICADRATALTEHMKQFQAVVQQIVTHMNFIHCIIYAEALTSRDLEPKSRSVLQERVKVMNLLGDRPLNYCLFAVLSEEKQAEHK